MAGETLTGHHGAGIRRAWLAVAAASVGSRRSIATGPGTRALTTRGRPRARTIADALSGPARTGEAGAAIARARATRA